MMIEIRRAVVVVRTALLAIAAAVGLGGTAAPMAAQDGPPAPLAMEPVRFPEYHRATLSNGAQLLVVQNHEQPVVTVNLRIRSGSAADPEGKGGLATLTADVLDKGTPTRTGDEIAETIDFVGATLSASASDDWTRVTVSSLTEFLDSALVILSDVVQNPTFPAEDLGTERKRMLSGLQVELSQPASVAERRFMEHLYGEHPYGRLPTPGSVRSITRDDLVEFHSRHYRPGNALFVVAGAVDPDEIEERIEARFGEWSPADVPEPTAMTPPGRSAREILLYHKPGAVQAVVRVGQLMPSATGANWIPLDVAVQILGGGGTGWLFDVLRQQKGYTYGAYATSGKRIGPSYFQAFAEVRNEVADSAMAELFALLDSVRTGIPESDLDLAQDYITGSFPRQIETPQQVAGRIATTLLRGLGVDYLEEYRDRVAALDVDEVRSAAERHLEPGRMLVVVVGDATEIHEKLTPFGQVRLFDVEGEPLALEDLEVRAAELNLDPSILEPGTWIYSLVVQGNPFGEFTTTVTRESVEGRPVVKGVTDGGGMGLQVQEQTIFDARDFTPVSFQLTQTSPQGTMAVDLRYRDGRVTGTVSPPQGDTTEVDTEVPAGTILPGMDGYVIWLADFEGSPELEVPAFNARSGKPYTLGAKVVSDTTITTPAGEFETLEVELSTAEGTQRLFVRKARPHIVVRQEFSGQPIVFELKEIREGDG